ncbi:phage tail assembly chaperone [Candidatus Clostridium helianthi]|uniref:Phage tail assembly chaperone n=1 Tax=Candidatus Clostridium helianthi TaxID=3381660 RepID=A0ABW8S5Q4_9CLOT
MKKNEKDEVLAMKEEDILAKLLETHDVPVAIIQVPRLGVEIQLKGLTEKEISRLREECTTKRKINGRNETKLNNADFDAALIVGATTNFNWNNPKLIDPLNLSDGKAYIRKKLLAGEISFLANKVLELSGFNDELEEKEDIKN